MKGEMISTLSDIVKSYHTIQWLTLKTCQQPDNAVDMYVSDCKTLCY